MFASGKWTGLLISPTFSHYRSQNYHYRKIIQSPVTSNVMHLYLRFKSDLSVTERLDIMLSTIFRQTESTQLHMQVSLWVARV